MTPALESAPQPVPVPAPTAPPAGLRHASAPDDAWWRSAVIYQVYPRSFADADGDGNGDLAGLLARLPHLVDLGVDALWISPFYPSPQADGGYDVADYCDADPMYGTLADAERVIQRAHELGLRVVIDLVPNHTSSAHPWFTRALAAGPGAPEREWYLFRDADPEDPERPPNDWPSEFGGSAWSPTDDGQWYLHLFDASQPDLNWEHPGVQRAFADVLRFWLDRGVDGFRVDVAHGLVKRAGLPDFGHGREALATGDLPTAAAPFYDQDGVHDIYRSWRRILDEYPGERIMVAEAWVRPADRLARYVRADEHHQAFNFSFLSSAWTPESLRERIAGSYRANDAVGAPTTWVLSNHDVIRTATRLALPEGAPSQLEGPIAAPDRDLGLRRARAAAALMLALPGSAYLFQGEELGLPEVLDLPPEARRDPTFRRTAGARLGRDGCRVPIPWERDAPAFGFGPSGASWLPQPQGFRELAVDAQRGSAGSTLELYRRLLALRRERGLGGGALAAAPADAEPHTLAFDVTTPAGTTRVIVNFGPERSYDPPAGARVLVASHGSWTGVLPTDAAVWVDVPTV